MGKMQPELPGVKSVEATAGLVLLTPECALAFGDVLSLSLCGGILYLAGHSPTPVTSSNGN